MRKGQFWGCPGHSKALAIFGAAAASRLRSLKRDHSIANNVMQQKGSFSMPRNRKQHYENFREQAMRPRTGWWDCTARAKSDI